MYIWDLGICRTIHTISIYHYPITGLLSWSTRDKLTTLSSHRRVRHQSWRELPQRHEVARATRIHLLWTVHTKHPSPPLWAISTYCICPIVTLLQNTRTTPPHVLHAHAETNARQAPWQPVRDITRHSRPRQTSPATLGPALHYPLQH